MVLNLNNILYGKRNTIEGLNIFSGGGERREAAGDAPRPSGLVMAITPSLRSGRGTIPSDRRPSDLRRPTCRSFGDGRRKRRRHMSASPSRGVAAKDGIGLTVQSRPGVRTRAASCTACRTPCAAPSRHRTPARRSRRSAKFVVSPWVSPSVSSVVVTRHIRFGGCAIS